MIVSDIKFINKKELQILFDNNTDKIITMKKYREQPFLIGDQISEAYDIHNTLRNQCLLKEYGINKKTYLSSIITYLH